MVRYLLLILISHLVSWQLDQVTKRMAYEKPDGPAR